MPAKTPPRKTKVTSPVGLTDHLRTKARQRREGQGVLTSIGRHAPPRRNDLLPQLAISYVDLDQIQPALRRVRRNDEAQTARVLASIHKFSIVAPILVRASLPGPGRELS